MPSGATFVSRDDENAGGEKPVVVHFQSLKKYFV
jgi:hypothetical protein